MNEGVQHHSITEEFSEPKCQTSASSTSTTGGSTRVAWDLSVVSGADNKAIHGFFFWYHLVIFGQVSGFLCGARFRI